MTKAKKQKNIFSILACIVLIAGSILDLTPLHLPNLSLVLTIASFLFLSLSFGYILKSGEPDGRVMRKIKVKRDKAIYIIGIILLIFSLARPVIPYVDTNLILGGIASTLGWIFLTYVVVKY